MKIEQYKPYSELNSYKRKKNNLITEIRHTIKQFENPGISFSGGKDSLVLLHIIQQVLGYSDIHVFFYDSGAEYEDTIEYIEKIEKEFGLNLTIIDPFVDNLTIAKRNGALGYNGEEYKGYAEYSDDDIKNILIHQPVNLAIQAYSIDCVFVGLRKEESKKRKVFLSNGKLQFLKKHECYHCYPLADWVGEDILAYIAENNLPYHPIYDKLALHGEDPRWQRVGGYLSPVNVHRGRFLFMKKYYPELFNKLSIDFPEIKTYV